MLNLDKAEVESARKSADSSLRICSVLKPAIWTEVKAPNWAEPRAFRSSVLSLLIWSLLRAWAWSVRKAANCAVVSAFKLLVDRLRIWLELIAATWVVVKAASCTSKSPASCSVVSLATAAVLSRRRSRVSIAKMLEALMPTIASGLIADICVVVRATS